MVVPIVLKGDACALLRDHTQEVWKIWTIAQTDGHQFRGQTRVRFSKVGRFHTSGALVRKNPQPLEECFCVRLRSPPPVTLAKRLSLHSDPPRPAPSLAGFRTLACGLGARFPGPFSGVFSRFPLSFSAPCGRAKRQVRKAKFIKINDLAGVATPKFFPQSGPHLNLGEREKRLKSAQPHALCWHALPLPPRRSVAAALPNTAACPWPGRTTRPPRATCHPESPPGCPAPASSD